jgi:hypothetical protein
VAMQYVFISFSTPDAATASDLATALENHGVRVFYSPRSIAAGASFDAAVVVWSKRASSSPWVRREVETLTDRHISAAAPAFPLFVASLDDTRPPEILRTNQRIPLDTADIDRVARTILKIDSPSRAPVAVRRVIGIDELSQDDVRMLAALLHKGGIDMQADAVPPVLRWRSGDSSIVVDVNLDFLRMDKGRLARFDASLKILQAHERHGDFYRRQSTKPIAETVFFGQEIEDRQEAIVQELGSLRELLRPCIGQIWRTSR